MLAHLQGVRYIRRHGPGYRLTFAGRRAASEVDTIRHNIYRDPYDDA